LPARRSSRTHGLVVVGGPDGRVDDEHHDVGEVDGDLGLLGDPRKTPSARRPPSHRCRRA
jgi:hypothetical protein